MADNNFTYSAAGKGFYHPPLDRFIPTLPVGAAQEWLEKHTSAGSLIIDPLGANPMLAVEAAQSGRRVLVSRNNPILWLILEVIASAPGSDRMRSAISKLLITHRGEEVLESHLKSMYATPCAACGKMIQPAGFIWEKGGEVPSARVYSCPHCGDEGERNLSQHDLDNLNQLGRLGLHRKRAFQRVLHGGEYEQESIETALDCYLPRAIYSVMMVMNTIDGLLLDKKEKRLIQAAALIVFDDANSLWHWPERDQRHLVLSVPTRFLEKNLWLSLESAAERWSISGNPIPVSYWPNIPPQSGGICFYQRRLLDQENFFKGRKPAAAAAVFPRPNQAFWTLSALWSGWLWGRKAVSPMRSALSRRRYDWYWFAQAVQSALAGFSANLQPGLEMFGILPQAAANHFLGMLAGSRSSGFQLQGAAYRESDEIVQAEWRLVEDLTSADDVEMREMVQEYLSLRGEPAGFPEILIHCITQLIMENRIAVDLDQFDDGLFRQIQERITTVLADNHFAMAFTSNRPGGSRWWLLDSRAVSQPLSERVEERVQKILLEQKNISPADLDHMVCGDFPGSQTPEHELVKTCLKSYADPESGSPQRYTLRSEESTSAREEDLRELSDILVRCGRDFGLKVTDLEKGIHWSDPAGKTAFEYIFSINSPNLKTFQGSTPDGKITRVIVFPGSRSRLIDFRLRSDPRLASLIEGSWHFLKFRYLRWMADRENLTLEIWEELLDGDPPLWNPPTQIQML